MSGKDGEDNCPAHRMFLLMESNVWIGRCCLGKKTVVSVAGSLVVLFNHISGGLAPNTGKTHLARVISRHQGQLSWIYLFPVWEKGKWLTRVLHLSFSARYLRSRQEASPDLQTPAVIAEETLGKYLLCFVSSNTKKILRGLLEVRDHPTLLFLMPRSSCVSKNTGYPTY